MSKIIDRDAFWHLLTRPVRPLNQQQVDNLNFLLDKLDASKLINRLSEYAYVLATIFHETAHTFAPVQEAYWLKPEAVRIRALKAFYWRQRATIYPDGMPLYTGRGLVQITHKYNYENMQPLILQRFPLVDIVKEPDLALRPEIAWIIVEEGMTRDTVTFRDVNFTGYTLEQFFNDEKTNFIGARKIVNDSDRASLIASYAEVFYNALQFKDAG